MVRWLLVSFLLVLGCAQAQAEIFYEIFVRSFQDSDGDGIGDLRGVTERLDYLQDLGVTGLWLMPIHPSPSYHGYDVTDYTTVNPDYGTLQDFDDLVAAAEARGIRVVLDLVVNHSSDRHPWFLAASGGDLRYRDFYLWSETDLGWRGTGGGPAWHRNPYGDGYYLGLFVESMPDLNLRNPAVTAELQSIARFWLERGVSGFRVDAIQHLIETSSGGIRNTPETLAWVRDFERYIKTVDEDAFLVGETWTDPETIAQYLGRAELDYAFDYPLFTTLVGTRDSAGVLRSRNPANLRLLLERAPALYPDLGRLATFLSNHDQVRPATSLGLLRRDEARLKLAAGLLFALPGVPFIYYGEELGMPNGPGERDEDKRTPMRWTPDEANAGFSEAEPWYAFSTDEPGLTVAAQQEDPDSLLNWYKRLIQLRHDYPQLQDAALELLDTGSGPFAFTRTAEDWRALVVINFSADEASFDLGSLGVAGATDLLSGEAVGGALTLPPTSLRLLELP